uniref:Protein argonaute-2 n=2 Tax=Culex pipiens TaxID=7175 RepID=A0A8D8BH98_CULPI
MESAKPKGNHRGKKKPQSGDQDVPEGTSGQTAGPPQGQQQKQQKSGQGGGGKYKQKQLLKQQQQQDLQQQTGEGTQILLPTTSNAPTPPSQPIEKSLAKVKLDLVRPKNYGVAGTPVKLEVNYLALNLDKLPAKAYHYDVDIQPAASRKWQRACFSRFRAEALPNRLIAYDGHKNAYTMQPMDPMDKVGVAVSLDNRERRFTVRMKLAKVVDLRSLKGGNEHNQAPAKQCLEVVFGTASDRDPRLIRFKRSCYFAPLKRIKRNHELWYGLHQSLILGSKLFLNIDVAHKAFPSGVPVLDVVGDLARRRWNDSPNVPERIDDTLAFKLHNFLKGLEVSYTGPSSVKKVFKYNSLRGPASSQLFKREDGTKMTLAAYFTQQGYRLRHPELPVMHVGSTVRNIMLPMELCQILPGQALNKKHPDECTAQIIKRAATDAPTRKRKIMELRDQISYSNCPIIKEFGIGVGKDFEVIDGRIIAPPLIEYKNRRTVLPEHGQWSGDNEGFITSNQRELRWIILNLDSYNTRQSDVDSFGNNVFNESRKKGMQLEPFSMQNNYYEPRNTRMNMKQLETELENSLGYFKKQQLDFVIVVIGDHYSRLKQKAELVVGVLTSCVKGNTVKNTRSPLTVVNNILLKINGKTNGTNHVVQSPDPKIPLIKKRIMFVGADVTHPSPEQSTIPSVVGVVASFDRNGFRYKPHFQLQDPKEEMIHGLEAIMQTMLNNYKNKNNQQLPEMILYYRDGVSDGQFSQVLDIELNAINRAVAAMNPPSKINVTFVVVQKRHHTRFFPGPKCPKEVRNQNVPPGTIVDRYITTPKHFQFFLTSHIAVQGVAKPSKYTVLHDDEQWDPDRLQAITYALCHMYARCNRSVSYPAPTYYAHWAAARGKVYIQGRTLNMAELDRENSLLRIRPEIIEERSMFFI